MGWGVEQGGGQGLVLGRRGGGQGGGEGLLVGGGWIFGVKNVLD